MKIAWLSFSNADVINELLPEPATPVTTVIACLGN
ncbi:Uncharacterised protein [Streptococcus pneumoniae]|nr:Uncharacterised protein [Streptococcus pneumoniae]